MTPETNEELPTSTESVEQNIEQKEVQENNNQQQSIHIEPNVQIRPEQKNNEDMFKTLLQKFDEQENFFKNKFNEMETKFEKEKIELEKKINPLNEEVIEEKLAKMQQETQKKKEHEEFISLYHNIDKVLVDNIVSQKKTEVTNVEIGNFAKMTAINAIKNIKIEGDKDIVVNAIANSFSDVLGNLLNNLVAVSKKQQIENAVINQNNINNTKYTELTTKSGGHFLDRYATDK
jgi:hypothetical protein